MLFLRCSCSACIDCHVHDKQNDPKMPLALENHWCIQERELCAICKTNPERKQNRLFDQTETIRKK